MVAAPSLFWLVHELPDPSTATSTPSTLRDELDALVSSPTWAPIAGRAFNTVILCGLAPEAGVEES